MPIGDAPALTAERRPRRHPGRKCNSFGSSGPSRLLTRRFRPPLWHLRRLPRSKSLRFCPRFRSKRRHRRPRLPMRRPLLLPLPSPRPRRSSLSSRPHRPPSPPLRVEIGRRMRPDRCPEEGSPTCPTCQSWQAGESAENGSTFREALSSPLQARTVPCFARKQHFRRISVSGAAAATPGSSWNFLPEADHLPRARPFPAIRGGRFSLPKSARHRTAR